MFYSHEILTSTQYGVATIWLVASVGPRSNTRKITRKAIQGVDIPRACDTIIKPGAPIALRLQGNLLYGVSRVYDQQCTYMLTDVEKVQSNMQTFYRVWGTCSIDPQAGKSKRDQLIILDDPAFDPTNFRLPEFRIDDDGNLLIDGSVLDTQMTSSQMSPHSGRNNSSSGSLRSLAGVGFDISSSPGAGINLHQLDNPFARDSILSQKAGEVGAGLGNITEEDPIVMDDDWGIRIDEDGNVILVEDEARVPPPELPDLQADPAVPDHGQSAPALNKPGQAEDDGPIHLGEDALPEAEAFPQRRSDEQQFQPGGSSSSASAPLRRTRKKPVIMPDEKTHFNKAEMDAMAAQYAARNRELRRKTRPTPLTQARRTAYNLTFGFGIGGVGRPHSTSDVVSPLAKLFAGPALERSILGFSFSDQIQQHNEDGEEQLFRGRRRTSGEAFPESDTEQQRRVRPRVDVTPQVGGQGQQQDAQVHQLDDDAPMLDLDDGMAELGRDAPPSGDQSRVSAPWNRSVMGSSAHGNSSIKAMVGRQVSASPLLGRGQHSATAIERFSDDAPVPFGSDPAVGFGGAGEMQSSPAFEEGESKDMRAALDEQGGNFLQYLERIAGAKGVMDEDDESESRAWVEFEDLFEEGDRNREVVTQAFFHVLTLATRNMVRVQQEDSMVVPFGTIRVGVTVRREEVTEEETEAGVVVV